MSAFKVCEKTEEIGVLPDGLLLVDNVTMQIRIVTSAGDSMAPRSRAIVPANDTHVQNLVNRGTLRVVLTGIVKDLTEVVLIDESGEQIGTTSVVAALEETPEPAKKNRKKKTEVQQDAEPEVEEIQEEEEEEQEENSSDVEISIIDTATDNENPSV
jgi:hypothetical protein